MEWSWDAKKEGFRSFDDFRKCIGDLERDDVLGIDDVPADFIQAVRGSAAAAGTGGAPPPGDPAHAWPADFKEARDQFERAYLRQIVEACGGNMAQAARLSGISRRHLYEKFDKLGVSKDGLRES